MLPNLARMGRGGWVAEGARLELVYTATYRGFESLSLLQTTINRNTQLEALYSNLAQFEPSMTQTAGFDKMAV